MMTYRPTALVIAFLVSAAANPLTAQQGPRGAGCMNMGPMNEAGRMGQMGMMPQMGAFQPASLLERGAELSLTDEQRAALVGLRDGAAEARDAARAGHDSYATRLHDAMAADEPDVEQLRGLFLGAHGFMSQMRWAEIEAAVSAKTLLTEEQRALVAPDAGRRPMRMRGR